MSTLKHDRQRVVQQIFNQLNESEIPYVVPRKYDRLPEATLGDIDMYVSADRFDEAINICKRKGFERHGRPDTLPYKTLLTRATRNPEKALTRLFYSPKSTLQIVRGNRSHRQGYVNYKLRYGDIDLDINNHLAYISPYNGSRIRVDPSIEEQLFDRRQPHNEFYVPSPVDELAHIVPHCVFDKHGVFSGYYADQCDVLVEEVLSVEETRAEFRDLLTELFYGASTLVYELVEAGEYGSIRSQLIRFDEY